jgi:hypothetical protein
MSWRTLSTTPGAGRTPRARKSSSRAFVISDVRASAMAQFSYGGQVGTIGARADYPRRQYMCRAPIRPRDSHRHSIPLTMLALESKGCLTIWKPVKYRLLGDAWMANSSTEDAASILTGRVAVLREEMKSASNPITEHSRGGRPCATAPIAFRITGYVARNYHEDTEYSS